MCCGNIILPFFIISENWKAMEDVLPKSTIALLLKITKAHLQLPVTEYLLLVVSPEDLWHVLLHSDRSLFVLTNVNGVLQKRTVLLPQVCLLLLKSDSRCLAPCIVRSCCAVLHTSIKFLCTFEIRSLYIFLFGGWNRPFVQCKPLRCHVRLPEAIWLSKRKEAHQW